MGLRCSAAGGQLAAKVYPPWEAASLIEDEIPFDIVKIHSNHWIPAFAGMTAVLTKRY
jgi:hypothetical protein